MCLRKDVDVRTCIYFSSPFDIISVLLPFISLFLFSGEKMWVRWGANFCVFWVFLCFLVWFEYSWHKITLLSISTSVLLLVILFLLKWRIKCVYYVDQWVLTSKELLKFCNGSVTGHWNRRVWWMTICLLVVLTQGSHCHWRSLEVWGKWDKLFKALKVESLWILWSSKCQGKTVSILFRNCISQGQTVD